MTFHKHGPADGSVKRKLHLRKGVSLVEMLVVIAISSILLGVVTVTLVAMHDISRSLQNADAMPWGTPQLVEHLRQDIATATETRWDAEHQQLVVSRSNAFNLETEPVTFEFNGLLCTRVTINGNGEETKQLFKLPNSVSPLVEPIVAKSDTLLKITLVADGEAKQTPRFLSTNELIVLVGRNHNLFGAGEVR